MVSSIYQKLKGAGKEGLMAYRRKQGGGMSRSATFKEEKNLPPDDQGEGEWVATKGGPGPGPGPGPTPTYDYTSMGMGSSNETGSFWGVLARKAKAILEDDNMQQSDLLLTQTRTDHEFHYSPHHENIKATTHLNKIHMVRKGEGTTTHDLGEQQSPLHKPIMQYSKNPATQEDQLKASRDVAMATAAKAKLLLRELKTTRADLAFAKQRCSQLEEENKILRDAREDKGLNAADDDMIRRQLETLLAEKARLAHENSVYARENRVLREIVEYHQMTTQDVIYFDEANEEVTEDYPILSSISMPDSPTSSPPPAYLFRSASAHVSLH